MIRKFPPAHVISVSLEFEFRRVFLCLILPVICLLVACSTPSRHGGASLGDAAEASAKKAEEKPEDKPDPREESHEERTRERDEDPEPLQIGEEVEDDSVSTADAAIATTTLLADGSSPNDAQATPDADEQADRWHITPSFSLLGVAGDAYAMNWGAGLEVGAYVSNRVRVEGGVQYVDIEFLDSQDRIRGLKDPWELQADLRGRFYLTKAHTFASAYAVAGVKLGIFGWGFVEPLEVVEDGDLRTVSYDEIFTMTPYLGCGIAPVQWGKFHLGASFTAGIRILQPSTVEGFENDLFPDVGTWELRLDASYFL